MTLSVEHLHPASLPADPPENMFAPFTVLESITGTPQRTSSPVVHWGHVDSGSMVCIVYEGVLRAFPELTTYR